MRLLTLALFLILAGCGGSQPRTGGVLLAGSSWSVERIVTASGDVVRGTGETVAFGGEGSISISSCNSCQGRFNLRGDVLTVNEGLACTRRACSADTVELERFFAGEQTVARDGPYLVLTSASGEDTEPTQILLLPTQAPSRAPAGG